jgi:hypothetical protein
MLIVQYPNGQLLCDFYPWKTQILVENRDIIVIQLHTKLNALHRLTLRYHRFSIHWEHNCYKCLVPHNIFLIFQNSRYCPPIYYVNFIIIFGKR